MLEDVEWVEKAEVDEAKLCSSIETLPELKDLAERALAVVEGGVVIIDARDPSHPIIYCNEWFTKLTGYTAAEVIGRNCQFLQGPETKARPRNAIRRALKTGTRASVVIKNYRKGGSSFWNELNITPIFDEQGKPSHFVGIQRDVTQKVETKKHLLASMKKLEHLNTKLANTNIDLKTMNSMLHYRSLRDPLTHAANRSSFDDNLKRAIDLHKEHNDFQFAVLYIDLDNFKMINDSFGHQMGDEILIATAAILRRCVRPNDTVARLGGDEFAILLENLINLEEANHIAARIRKSLTEGLSVANRTVHVSASIGVVTETAEVASSTELLNNADSAMYRAKKLGKNRNIAFEPSMRSSHTSLHDDLRVALSKAALDVHFQPILSTFDASVIGFEALARWQHPERGNIPPTEFIPIAENTGLILELDLWVLQESCKRMVSWQAQSVQPLMLNVNFSGYHLLDAAFATQVETILKETGFNASQLVLELTESLMLNLNDDVRQTLENLKNLGVHIYIDDFGTGFSSFRYLQDIPSTALKIARPFIKQVHSNPKSQALLRAVVTLAHNLDMTVVAEGVESVEELEFVKNLGCEYVQGFFFHPAMTSAGVPGYLQERNEAVNPGLVAKN